MGLESHRLTDIVTVALKRRIVHAAQDNGGVVELLLAESHSFEQAIAELEADVKSLERQLRIERNRWTDEVSIWEEARNEERVTIARQEMRRALQPLTAAITGSEDKLKKLRASHENASTKTDPRALTEYLRDLVSRWDEVGIVEQRQIVDLFVDWVGVYALEDGDNKCGVITVSWTDGTNSVLISQRGRYHDSRDWTADEDAALNTFWSSDCTWEEIKMRLLPSRKIDAVMKRARSLRLCVGNRTNKWYSAIRESEKDYFDKNPDTLYLEFPRFTETPTAEIILAANLREVKANGTVGAGIPLPSGGCQRIINALYVDDSHVL